MARFESSLTKVPFMNIPDDRALTFGEVLAVLWDTTDANANCGMIELPAGGAIDVPVVAFGIDITGRDLGFFDGKTEPLFAVVDVDRDSWVGIGFNADDDAQILIGGSAVLTLPALTLGGDVTGGNYDLDNIGHIGLGNQAANSKYGAYWYEVIAIDDNNERVGAYFAAEAYKTTAAFTNVLFGGYFNARLDYQNTQNWTNAIGLIGLRGGITLENGSSSETITGAAPLYIGAAFSSIAAAATLTNYYGIYIAAEALVGNSKLTNDYGIYIGSQAGGATLNYAIYTAGGDHYFGDVSTFADDVTIANTKGLVTGIVDDDYVLLKAVDNDTQVLTEVARLTGAATPTFDILAGKLTGGLNANAQNITALASIYGRANENLNHYAADSSTGGHVFGTRNANTTTNTNRLTITGGADIATATWSAVTHTGFISSGRTKLEATAYTASGAIGANVGTVELNQAGSAILMTLADPGDSGYLLVITQIDAGTQGHTVTTATAGGFDGTNNTATFNAQNETLVLYSISATRWVIVQNIGGVGLSAV